MSEDAIDLKYARQAAAYIGSDHTEIFMTPGEVTAVLDPLIGILGTYDITTIRASIGMYLVCRAIHERTDIRVLLTGEISDELSDTNIRISRRPRRRFKKKQRSGSASFICMMCSAPTGAFP